MANTTDLFQAAFQNSSIGMAVIRPDGEIVRSNPAFSEIAGHTESNAASPGFWDLFTKTDQTASRDRVATLNHPGERYSWVVRIGGRRRRIWQLDVSVIGQEDGQLFRRPPSRG